MIRYMYVLIAFYNVHKFSKSTNTRMNLDTMETEFHIINMKLFEWNTNIKRQINIYQIVLFLCFLAADVYNSSHNDNRTSDKNSLKNSDFDAGSGKPDKQFLIKKFQESQIDYRTSQPSSSSHRSDHSKLDHRRDSYDHNRRRRDSEGNRSYGYRTPKKHGEFVKKSISSWMIT